jgi:ketosteroid isomerase-like protein
MSSRGPEHLARTFYDAFARQDATTMGGLYSNQATFSDPIFPNLNAQETQIMWAMLCQSAKNFSLSYEIREIGGDYVIVGWTAKYTFGPAGNDVENRVSTRLRFRDEKIVEHRDEFNFYCWARQALGLSGAVFGFIPFFQFKVQSTARNNLQKFIRRQSR